MKFSTRFWLGLVVLGSSSTSSSHAFVTKNNFKVKRRGVSSSSSSLKSSVTSTAATSTTTKPNNPLLERRRTLLSRDGPYFKIDRSKKSIEFGATAKLTTELNTSSDGTSDNNYIKEWLSDEKRVAMSIWDEKLIEPLGNNVYQLKIMKLRFITIQLQPTVDMRMWCSTKKKKKNSSTENDNNDDTPVFYLQSVDFDPNISVFSSDIDAKSLGIEIEVVGQLAPTSDGKGVMGRIAFQTSGKLPSALLFLPQSVIKAASDTINNTITNFAIRSFQKGAITKYREFVANKAELNKTMKQQ